MRSTLRTIAVASLIAVGSTSGLGVATARACDHEPGFGYGRTASWGYSAQFGQPGLAQYAGMPSYDRCPICHPGPPPCTPPPYEPVSVVVRQTRRVTYSGLQAVAFDSGPAPAYPAYDQAYGVAGETLARYPSLQTPRSYSTRPYAPGPYLPYPTKQTPEVYGTPQTSGSDLPPDGYISDSSPRAPFAAPTPPPLPTPSHPYPGQPPQG